jgi:hypothetical protein
MSMGYLLSKEMPYTGYTLAIYGVQNVSGIPTTEKEEICWFLRRKVVRQTNSRCISDRIEEDFLGPYEWMRHRDRLE